MTIAALVTEGIGSYGDVAHVVTDGLDIGAAPSTNVIATILTEGFGMSSPASAFVVTEGFGSSSTPTPTPTPASTSTPGRIRRLAKLERDRGESEAEKLARRIREGTIPAPVEPVAQKDDSAYFVEAARLSKAIAKARADAETSRQAIERYTAHQERLAQSKVIQAKLLRAEQALLLAKVQEAVLIEEMEVIDIAYLAAVAITTAMQ